MDLIKEEVAILFGTVCTFSFLQYRFIIRRLGRFQVKWIVWVWCLKGRRCVWEQNEVDFLVGTILQDDVESGLLYVMELIYYLDCLWTRQCETDTSISNSVYSQFIVVLHLCSVYILLISSSVILIIIFISSQFLISNI